MIPMQISIKWHQQIELEDGSYDNLIFSVSDLSKFEDIPGVYMFCRQYSDNISPLYIGKAINLAKRIGQQLNTTKLVKAIENAQAGSKVLIIGTLNTKPGQVADKCIRQVEKALIEHALAEGYELINQMGTKTPYDEISFVGNKKAKVFTGSHMYIKKPKG